MKTFLQRMAIPLILKREHVLCAAQTGNFCFWWQLLILRVTKCSISEDFPPMVTKSSRRKKLHRRLSSFNFHQIVSPAHANTTQTATLNLRLLNTNCYSSVKQIYTQRGNKKQEPGPFVFVGGDEILRGYHISRLQNMVLSLERRGSVDP